MEWQWNHSTLPSVQACRRSALPGSAVALTMNTAGKAKIAGVRTCGSVWACPMCSGSVWAKRAEELGHLLRAAHAAGLQVAFITLTMRHHKRNKLEALWDCQVKALEQALGVGSRDVRDLRDELGVVGIVRRTEATHGANGWHLHPHLLLFAKAGDLDGFNALGNAMFDAWSDRLAKMKRPRPLRKYGLNVKVLDISDAEEAAASYVTFAGSFHAAAELTASHGKSARKGNRTTWELLNDAIAGDPEAAARWAEWEQASKGRRAWDNRSAALRELAAALPEESGQAPEEPDTIATLSEPAWKTVCRCWSVGELLGTAEAAYRQGIARSRGDHYEGLLLAHHAVGTLLQAWSVWPPGYSCLPPRCLSAP